MSKIVIFGATGTVGVYTALHLKKMGCDVIAVGRRTTDNNFFSDYNIPYYSVNIVNKGEFNKLPQTGVDIVIHYAGAMPARMKGYNPQEYIDTIVTGTLNVLDYTQKAGAQKIVFTQSISDCFWMVKDATPIPADIWRKFPPNNDHSIYVIAKNAAVDLIEHYHYKYGIARFILRLPTIYLYHPNPFYYVNGEKREMFYRQFIDKAIEGAPIDVWGDASKVKEIVYVKDFVQIVECCVKATIEGGFYNVGEEECVSLDEQIKGIVDIFGKEGNKSPIRYLPDMPDPSEFVFDISKTKEELGYKPAYDYRTALKDMKKEMEINPFEKLWGREEDYR